MSSVEQNLVEGNKAYAASFTDGHLALPPSQKYAVGASHAAQLPLQDPASTDEAQ